MLLYVCSLMCALSCVLLHVCFYRAVITGSILEVQQPPSGSGILVFPWILRCMLSSLDSVSFPHYLPIFQEHRELCQPTLHHRSVHRLASQSTWLPCSSLTSRAIPSVCFSDFMCLPEAPLAPAFLVMHTGIFLKFKSNHATHPFCLKVCNRFHYP